MGGPRRKQLGSSAAIAIYLAVIGVAIGFSGPAGGQTTEVTAVSGRAFGLQSTGILDIDPTPEVVLPATGGGPFTDELAELDLSPLLTVGLLRVSTEGMTGSDGFAESSSTVADVRLLGTAGDILDPVLDLGGLLDLDQLLGGTGLFIEAVESECLATAEGVAGSTTLVGINEAGDADPDNIVTFGTGESLDIDLGPLVRVVINEQEVTEESGFNEIVVNGARVTLLGNDGDDIDPDPDALLDVVLARSECDVSFTDGEQPTTTTTVRPGPGTPTGPHASNDSNVSNESDGTAVIGTGDATAVGNISNTEINQTASGSSVDQSADVVNAGGAAANTGANSAVGNNSLNEASNDQSAVAVDDGPTADSHDACNPCAPPSSGPTAGNTSSVSNHSDGTAVIGTGDATAVGNISNTEINQSADSGAPPHPCVPENPCTCTTTCTDPCPPTSPCHPCVPESPCQPCSGDPCQPCSGDPCLPCGGTCWGFWPGFGNWGGSAVSQSAHVVNAGDAQANTGGNTAVGNNSQNFASNNQTAVAAR